MDTVNYTIIMIYISHYCHQGSKHHGDPDVFLFYFILCDCLKNTDYTDAFFFSKPSTGL